MGDGTVQGDGYAVGHIDQMGALYVIVGGKDGYVGRDGRAPDGETSRFGPAGPPGA